MEKRKGLGLLLLEGQERPVPVRISLSLKEPQAGYHLKWYGDCLIADRRDAGTLAAKTGYHARLLLWDGRQAQVLLTQAGHDQISFTGDQPLGLDPPEGPAKWCDVLIVEDELAMAKALERELEAAGYSTCICLDGGNCLLAISKMRPRLVLLDLLLPDLRCRELLMTFRAHPALGEVPVIVLTALDDSHAVDLHGASPDGFLRKPAEIPQVVERVRQFIEPRG